MTEVDGIVRLSESIMAQLRRERRFPTRLDEEDYADILQEGTLSALRLLDRFDPARGSLRAFMSRPMARAMLACAWDQAHCGITGNHDSLPVWSLDDNAPQEGHDAIEQPLADDVADEVEAFDSIWNAHYRN
jgi:DNA-directed RNA polymerase specialized sigma24 family protein